MAIDPKKPHAFLSYTRADDEDYFKGGISWLRAELEKAVRAHTGYPFQIFQDVEDIQTGERWAKKLDQALKSAQIFIPILTPSFLRSDFCRREAKAWLDYEEGAARGGLILPLYLIRSPALENAALLDADPIAKALLERQHQDWRPLAVKLQHESTRFEAAEKINTLAQTIADMVEPDIPDDHSVAAVEPEPAQRPKSFDAYLPARLEDALARLAVLEQARAADVDRLTEEIKQAKEAKDAQEIAYKEHLEAQERTFAEERRAWQERDEQALRTPPTGAPAAGGSGDGAEKLIPKPRSTGSLPASTRRLMLSSVAGVTVIALGWFVLDGVKIVPFGPETTRKPGTVFRDCDRDLCPEMVVIPAGSFLMGSPEDEEGRYDDEGPQHRVTISNPFAIGQYEVTFEEYDFFAEATGRDKPDDEGWGRERRPVINVSWEDANAYCSWLGDGYRLPTEAEREYAARAGTTTRYGFGDDITKQQANFNRNIGRAVEVGGYPANRWGLYDVHGNVREWVADWKGDYPSSSVTDPEGPASGTFRVVRGGSWDVGAQLARSAFRYAFGPGFRNDFLGFRCAGVQGA